MSSWSLGVLRAGAGSFVVSFLLLIGCQSNDSDGGPPPEADTTEVSSLEQDPTPSTLATRYLTYAYRGALLSSDHPLNDSLSALTSNPMGGRRLTVVDTFVVEDSQETAESEHLVQVRFPRSVQILSATWETSEVAVNELYSLQVQESNVTKAPHLVGWPAFQHHIQDVAPERADSILARIGPKLNSSSAETGV